MNYDLSELEERYSNLEESHQTSLEMYWSDITDFLDETDLDWVKKQNIKEEQDIEARKFSHAYKAFIEVFEPSVSTGNAFAFYEMDYDELVELGEELGLADLKESRIKEEKVPKDPVDDAIRAAPHEDLNHE
jgi:hypothetical protein